MTNDSECQNFQLCTTLDVFSRLYTRLNICTFVHSSVVRLESSGVVTLRLESSTTGPDPCCWGASPPRPSLRSRTTQSRLKLKKQDRCKILFFLILFCFFSPGRKPSRTKTVPDEDLFVNIYRLGGEIFSEAPLVMVSC